jgi:hypothetical protein
MGEKCYKCLSVLENQGAHGLQLMVEQSFISEMRKSAFQNLIRRRYQELEQVVEVYASSNR